MRVTDHWRIKEMIQAGVGEDATDLTDDLLFTNYTFCTLWHSAVCRLSRPKAVMVL